MTVFMKGVAPFHIIGIEYGIGKIKEDVVQLLTFVYTILEIDGVCEKS